MKIGIIDDTEYYRNKLKQMILKLNKQAAIYTYQSAQDYIKHNHQEDLICLDIDMPEVNGIELKLYLNKNKIETKIIFVTSHENYVMDAFGMNVIGFVLKSNIEKLEEKLKEYIEYNTKKTICLNYEEININEIYFIDKEDKVTTLHLKDRKILSTYTLKKIMEFLNDDDFIYIKKDTIVNMNYIENYNKEEIVIQNKTLSISRRLKSEVEKKVREKI